ncbi:polyhydroxyalkanoate granule-associated phasin [Niveibacterium sp. SC-1]|uniref:polyhydroxyalkanoate granule-associated phasin n=1 Tax=Niveibacterium sp. SC-1 TaxID=3135646 RepID=UPI003120463E
MTTSNTWTASMFPMLPLFPAFPFASWNRLAWRTAGIAFDSAQVIGHRVHRMAIAGPVPSARDQHEFALMGQEKVEAGVASAQAAATGLALLNPEIGALLLKQMFAASQTLLAISASNNAGQASERSARLMRDSVEDAMLTASALSRASVRIAHVALTPVQARVRSNLARLGRA